MAVFTREKSRFCMWFVVLSNSLICRVFVFVGVSCGGNHLLHVESRVQNKTMGKHNTSH